MKGNLVRSTTIALSAVALAATLGACGQATDTTKPDSNGAGQEQSSGPGFSDIASLVSGADSSMGEKKTVVMGIQMSGGAAVMPQMRCQVDIAQTSMACTGDTMELVATPDATYTKIPGLAETTGKAWIKTVTDPNNPLSGGAQAGSFQKMTDFKQMLPAGSTITSSAPEKVDGKDATRYEITTDLTKAVAEGAPEQKAMYKVLVDSGITEVKQTVWADADGLPAKVNAVTPPMNVMGQQVPETTTTVTYKDWGKPVTITVPPADQVQQR